MAPRSLLALILPLGLARAATATLIYDELASGDLSSSALAPTLLVVDLGSNFLSASASSKDRDYFTLRLPPGAALAGVMLRRTDGVEATFLSLQPGSTFSEPPVGTDLTRTLGYTTFFRDDVNSDLLPKLASGPEAIGFSGPLLGAEFTFWVEQLNTNPAAYDLEFVIASIPSPGAWALAAIGATVSLWTSRRARRWAS